MTVTENDRSPHIEVSGRFSFLWLSLLMCLMFTLWGASPLGVISNASPLGVPADLQSADKKGSTSLLGICNPQP